MAGMMHVIIRLALLLSLVNLELTREISGYAAHYADGVMERVAHNRKMSVVPCMIAGVHIPLGRWVEVVSGKTGHAEYCRVTDVTAPKDIAKMDRRGIIIELGWPEAKRFCQLKYVRQEPPRACPVTVRFLSPELEAQLDAEGGREAPPEATVPPEPTPRPRPTPAPPPPPKPHGRRVYPSAGTAYAPRWLLEELGRQAPLDT